MVEYDAYLHDTVAGVEKSNESAIAAVRQDNVVSSLPQVVDQGGGGVQGVETCSTILSRSLRDARRAGLRAEKRTKLTERDEGSVEQQRLT